MSEIQSNGREKIVFPKSLKAGKEITELTTVKKATLTSTENFLKLKYLQTYFIASNRKLSSLNCFYLINAKYDLFTLCDSICDK